jgi:hypothetical protein
MKSYKTKLGSNVKLKEKIIMLHLYGKRLNHKKDFQKNPVFLLEAYS